MAKPILIGSESCQAALAIVSLLLLSLCLSMPVLNLLPEPIAVGGQLNNILIELSNFVLQIQRQGATSSVELQKPRCDLLADLYWLVGWIQHYAINILHLITLVEHLGL